MTELMDSNSDSRRWSSPFVAARLSDGRCDDSMSSLGSSGATDSPSSMNAALDDAWHSSVPP